MEEQAASAALKEAFADDWRWEVLDNPEFGSQAGVHETAWPADGILQAVNPASYAARSAHSQAMASRLRLLLESGELSPAESRLAALVESQHTDMVHSLATIPMHLLPVNSIGAGGICFSFLESLEWIQMETAADVEIVVKRVDACPRQIEQFIESMQEGLRTGFVASAAQLRRVNDLLTGLADGAGPFEELAPALSLAEQVHRPDLTAQLHAGSQLCRAAFGRLREFMRVEYMPRARADPACSALPSGAAGYATCLRYHTTTTLTAEAIHALGLQEVAAIEARYLTDVCQPLGFPDFPTFLAHAKAEPRFIAQSADDLLEHYRATTRRIEAVLPRYFNEFPRSPLSIVAADKGPCAYYLAGTADGKRPGKFYVNCSNLPGKPMYEAMALALHEGVPGHHHQVSLALENETLPKVLRHVEDRRYEVCPCRRQLFSAYVEGWALYCEFLGEEMGLYETPYELFGRLSMDMMRAVRLVVDTGLHALGWSIPTAVSYFREKTGMHEQESEKEVYRYASWPGQAVAYKIGQLEILRLRRKAEAELGRRFDLRAFHSLLLNSGALTLTLLDTMVDDFIATSMVKYYYEIENESETESETEM
jgi:uncharacterized protein (DUF885 family)